MGSRVVGSDVCHDASQPYRRSRDLASTYPHTSYTSAMRQALLLSAQFYRWGNRGVEWLSNIHVQGHRGRTLTQTQAAWCQSPVPTPCTTLPGDTSEQPNRGDAPWAVYKDDTTVGKFPKDYHFTLKIHIHVAPITKQNSYTFNLNNASYQIVK